ncbi:AMP-binding protein [Nostoc sp.]|uniref:AMP-binding protein n=1 Tax=Nostoc sp. TaxID=1180 RepID=UPI002FFB88A9
MQLNNSQFLANSTNKNFIYREIEVAIRSSLTVDDCVVIERQTQKRKQELVAYVVPSGLFAPEQLLFHLQTILPSELMPTALVPVSTIPLTVTGQLDKAALANLEVIESNLMRRIEEQLESLSEIERVKVVVEPFVISVPPVHLEDLLDETQAMPPVTSPKIAPEHSQQNIQANTFSQKIENKNPSFSKKLAISYGEPLQYSKDASKTLQEVLQRTAQNSTKGIIYIQSDGSEKVQSYRELWQDAQRILAGLRKLGLKPQDKVIFQLEDNQDFICAFWGCVLGGFVPVPVSIAPSYEPVNSTASKLQNAWQMLGKPIVLTSASLAPNIDGFFRLLNLENFQIATIDQLRECEPDFKLHQSQPEDLAILLLTSGSTGIPKCVILNHRNLLSMTAGLVSMGHFSSQESVLNWMPLDHVGALVSLSIMAVSLGCQQIHVTTDLIVQNPLKWLDLIDKHQATISWAPNFAFSLICDALGDVSYGTLRERYQAFDIERQKWDLSSMKFIINAGEPIVTKTAGEALLPKALVPVSGIPLTATGEVDELALINIPVIDESLIGQVEKQLNYHHKIEQAVVVVQELRKKILPLHLSDLIPGWQHQNASANLTPLPKDSQSNTQQYFSESKPLAISHGDILRSDRNAPITLPEVLQKAVQQVASGEIIYLLPDGTELRQSYAELLEVAERILSGLRKLGLKPKNKVILQIELSCDIIPAFWGCLLGGFVPVIMEVPPTYRESNKVVDKLCYIWQFLDSPVILTTEALKQEVELLSQWLPTERLNIGTIEVLKCNPVSKQYHHSQPDEVALFNLTSGSTGIQKCVQLTHKNLIIRARGANQLNQHEREDVILNWLPFDHIGSISDWHIRGIVLGCTLVYAQKEYILGRILNWLDLIHKYRITHSWSPNFAYAIVNDSLKQEPEQTWNLSCVKFLLTAGEAVSSKAVEDFRENLVVYGLKTTAIRPAFGMAEMGSGITYYQPIKEAPLLFHRVEKSRFQGTIKRV